MTDTELTTDPEKLATEDAADPYQADFGPYYNDDWFRHQNEEVRSRDECLTCKGSVPWSDELRWKYAAAGGCLEGPFCSKECYWRWMADGK